MAMATPEQEQEPDTKLKRNKKNTVVVAGDAWRCLVLGIPPRGTMIANDRWMRHSIRARFPEQLSVQTLQDLLDKVVKNGRTHIPLYQTQRCVLGTKSTKRSNTRQCEAIRDAMLELQKLIVKHKDDWLMRWESPQAGWGIVWGPNAATSQPGQIIEGLVGTLHDVKLTTHQVNHKSSSLVQVQVGDSKCYRELAGPLSYINSGCKDCCVLETHEEFTRVARAAERTVTVQDKVNAKDDSMGLKVGDKFDPVVGLLVQTQALLVGTFMSIDYGQSYHASEEQVKEWCRRCAARRTLEDKGVPLLRTLLKGCTSPGVYQQIWDSYKPSDERYTIKNRSKEINQRNIAKWILFFGGESHLLSHLKEENRIIGAKCAHESPNQTHFRKLYWSNVLFMLLLLLKLKATQLPQLPVEACKMIALLQN